MANPNIDISQVYGGGGNAGATFTNDFIELYNYGTTDVSVSGWSVQYASATGTAWQVTTLTGTIQAGHYYLIQEAAGTGGSTALPTPDVVGTINMSGTAGKVALSSSTAAFSGATPSSAIDFVGYGATANAFEGSGPAPAPSNTTADIRTPSGTDTNDNSKDFKTGAAMPRNMTTSGTTPPPSGTTVAIGDAAAIRGADGTTTETFSVTRSDTTGAFTLNYATADGSATAGTDYTAGQGSLSFAAGGPATQTITVPITPDANAPTSENFTVNLTNLANTAGAASFSKASATGTIITKPTPIYTIQGSGFASPLDGQSVTTDGIVTAVASNGYYLQDAKGDGNAATSDGLFVFTSTAPGVAVGDLLATTGKVQEFTPSSAGTGAFSTTELSGITATNVVSHDNALPAAVVIGPDGLSPPTEDLAAGNAFYESLEGMRVTVENPQAVGPTNSFGEIETVAADGQGATGLNGNGDLLISEGQPSFGNTDSQGGDFNPERIKIDSGLVSGAVPAVNLGTHFTSTTGILSYAFDQFGVSATSPLVVSKASTITPTVGTLTGDATHLTFGSYNIENFTNSSGVAGQGPTKTSTVASQIVTNLKSPDIIALQEVQDNNGPTDDGTISASTNLSALTTAISAAGGPQYAAIDNPFIGNGTNGGQPGGNIRTAYLYNPARVTFVQGSLATVSANGTVIRDQGTAAADAMLDSDQQTNIQNPFYASRPPLSAQFLFNGQAVTIVDNHFTSKGGSGDLMGSTQPAFNGGEVQRAGQAQAINNYVDSLLAADPNAKIIVTGDLNEFNGEEPLAVLQGTASISGYAVGGASASTSASATYTAGGAQVLTDLEGTLPAGQQYDYNFEGNSESLVHTLASNALTPDAQLQVIHINSEYARQTSDHDPLLTSFAIAAAPVCYAAGTLIRSVRDGSIVDVPVETLVAGDMVVTASNEHRMIRWMGHRGYAGRFANTNPDVLPVCVKAGALADGVPARDLRVSPKHAMMLDGVLVPAEALVNGVSVVKAARVERIEYWHVELDSHDVLIAEGAASESYIDDDNRAWFHNLASYRAAFPGAEPTDPVYCAPRLDHGEAVEAIRRRLATRAALLAAGGAGALEGVVLARDAEVAAA